MMLVAASAHTQENCTMKNEEIIQTIRQVFDGADERNWSKIESSLAPEVLLDYTSMSGGEPARLTPQQIITAWKGLLPGFKSTHHQTGNYTIAVNGREATAHFHGLALHYLPGAAGGEYWIVSGTYDYKLINVNEE